MDEKTNDLWQRREDGGDVTSSEAAHSDLQIATARATQPVAAVLIINRSREIVD